ncbi:trypsin-3-like [Lethenteron reissneri]|uniref:trypsin-3-like n=1 Tax=Lethenteron reissneri TaxID=7753 RepID=UPI002AB5EB21|nr:trypsin-3-like [Lethenteron reissneri]
MQLVLVLSSLLALALAAPRSDDHIVGGFEVSPNSIKYQVSLQQYGSHFCGGSLLSSLWVLSAAHCKIAASAMTVVLGEHSLSLNQGTEQVLKVSKVISHPSYNADTMNNDVLLIKLQTAASLNSYVGTVGLPSQGASLSSGTTCRVSGWGNTRASGSSYPDKLMAVDVPVISTTTCNAGSAYGGEITANMVCAGFMAGGKDSCQGDSGGPMVCGGLLHGVVSWGYGCAQPNKPGVYARVANFRSWIDQTMAAN